MNIITFDTYKAYLIEKIKENKGVYGYKAMIAKAAGCQRPYISQILSSKVHFTPEQALRLCSFWHFTERETNYFLNLVNKERAGTSELKSYYNQLLQQFRREHENLSERYERKDMPNEAQTIYYSNWLMSAVHMLVTVPEYQTVQVLSSRLNLSQQQLIKTLKQLFHIGLVEEKKGRWIPTNKNIHISKDALLSLMNHQNWKQRALIDVAAGDDQSIHYTAVYSLSRNDCEQLRNIVFEFIDKTRNIVGPSKEEEVVCFTCDLFKI